MKTRLILLSFSALALACGQNRSEPGSGSGGTSARGGSTGTGGTSVGTGGAVHTGGTGGTSPGSGGAAGGAGATGGRAGATGGQTGGNGGQASSQTGGGAGQTTGSGGAAGQSGAAGTSGASSFAVTTNRYDNLRSGVNLHEAVLTTANVKASGFGLLFSRAVDGQMYAEPLFVGGLTMADHKVHDVVYVATEHNTVYAFDATDPQQSAPLWKLNVGPSGSNGCDNLSPEIGITATPVIDQAAGVILFISKGQEGGGWVQRIHAVDLVTGAERPGSPTVLSASVAGTGTGASGGKIAFDPGSQLNRTGLLLVVASCTPRSPAIAIRGRITAGARLPLRRREVHAGAGVQRFSRRPEGRYLAGRQRVVQRRSEHLRRRRQRQYEPSAARWTFPTSVFRLRISDYSVQDYWMPAGYAA